MDDKRFARLKTDPRFRKPKKKDTKVVIDDRFASILKEPSTSKGKGKKSAKIDKYGRHVAESKTNENLRRFYRLDKEEDDSTPSGPTQPDYARGEGLLESSDEEQHSEEEESSDDDRAVTFGRDLPKAKKRDESLDPDELEIDLDESQFADLDSQAAANLKASTSETKHQLTGEETSRLAVVNLDWDHVRASDLYRVFSSVVENSKSKTATLGGHVVSVKVFPSEFGKERLAREEKEGPPPEIFQKKDFVPEEEMDEEDVNERTLFNVDDGDDSYNDDALRKYQLERLRYYYAIVTFDSISSSAYAYAELDGTELERSANMLDLSYVPEGMDFFDEPRDEATSANLSLSHKGLDFVTDALRHSKVKLTWDDDDAARVRVTRRTLTKKEIDENDFKAYIASSSSGEDSSDGAGSSASAHVGGGESKAARRERLRALLLGGDPEDNEELPEGWGGSAVPSGNLEVTFAPGLSEKGGGGDDEEEVDEENETTLERYHRKQREKKLARKLAKDVKEGEAAEAAEGKGGKGKRKENKREEVKEKDDFFGEESDESSVPKSKSRKGRGKEDATSPPPPTKPSTAEELELILAPDTAAGAGPKHFDMKEVLRAEKEAKRKGKKSRWAKKKGTGAEVGETGEDGADFAVNVTDERFTALFDQPEFAIDPSNPQFKATKAMTALVQERTKRQKDKTRKTKSGPVESSSAPRTESNDAGDIRALVESVKRKSQSNEGEGRGKRRKV